MSNTVPKLCMIAMLSFSATNAMADTWLHDCTSLSSGSSSSASSGVLGGSSASGAGGSSASGAVVPGACTEIQKTVSILDEYAPPQPFLNTADGQTFNASDKAKSGSLILQESQTGSSTKGGSSSSSSSSAIDNSDPDFQMGGGN